MSPLARRVLRSMRAHALIDEHDRVALAVSGGPDSVALVWLMREIEIADSLGGTVAGLIHVNHQLRGEESAHDEAFCRALAGRLDWPIEVAAFDVAALARAAGRSVEATARDVRYKFFADAAPRLGATLVATGHTLEDQAETVLLRLLRGAGSRGVAGIRVRRGMFIRPVLDCRRAELRQHLVARGEAFCEDSSNRDLRVPRNQVRHQLLPVIDEIAPGGIAALARFASLSAEDEVYLEQAAIKAAPGIVLTSTDGVQLDVRALAALPAPLGRRVLRRAIERVAPQAALTAVHIRAVLAMASAADPSGHLDLPGLQVERRGPTLCIEAAGCRGQAAGASRPTASRSQAPLRWGQDAPARGRLAFQVVLPVPGSVDIPEIGRSIVATASGSAMPEDIDRSREDVAVVQAATLALPFIVRSRRAGDRFRPLGAPGRRKLQDVLVDRKVPRQDRDRVPIVVDAAGRIVWVVGVAIAEECRVTAPATGVVVLKVLRKDLT